MAAVFLSYARDDTAKARLIAAALEKAGHSVWWDLHVRGGTQFSKVIEEALKAADVVVVLWSEHSVESAWVRDEACAGRDTGRLVPVSLDRTEPPLGFRQYQTIDFTRSKGRGRGAQFRALLDAVDSLGGKNEAMAKQSPDGRHERNNRFGRPALAGLAALVAALLTTGVLLWQPWRARSYTPIVAVTAAQQSQEANALAHDLLVQLGSLQASNTNALKLVALGSASRPNFIFEVSGPSEKNGVRANLALLDGSNRTLLWSRSFQQPTGREADLRQQIAYSAAQVLQCASELSNSSVRLIEDTEKLYLNGCAEFAETIGTDATNTLVPTFVRVVEEAPKFRDGWSKLLLAESVLVGNPALGALELSSIKDSLRRRIAQSRELHPGLAEISVARAMLLPPTAHAERLKLLDEAKRLDPDNSLLLVFRAHELGNVGRWIDAVADLTRAVQLEPLLPSVRDAYISSLAYSGRTAMAQDALQEAERLWPGTSSVLDASFRFHLRYGDPSKALQLLKSGVEGTGPVHDSHASFLQARIDPSPAKIDGAVNSARALVDRYGDLGFLIQALGEFGREEELYGTLERWDAPLDPTLGHVLFRPALRRFRQDARFMRVAARFGFVDLWAKTGKWPDFCFEPNMPYDCKAEAAKLG